jgi:hypothetical protein
MGNEFRIEEAPSSTRKKWSPEAHHISLLLLHQQVSFTSSIDGARFVGAGDGANSEWTAMLACLKSYG